MRRAGSAGLGLSSSACVAARGERVQGRALLEGTRKRIGHEWARFGHHAPGTKPLARRRACGRRRAARVASGQGRYPDSEEAAEGLWRFAEASRNREEEAARYYLRFAERFPKDARADDALLLAGRLYSDIGKNAEAIHAYGGSSRRTPAAGYGPMRPTCAGTCASGAATRKARRPTMSAQLRGIWVTITCTGRYSGCTRWGTTIR